MSSEQMQQGQRWLEELLRLAGFPAQISAQPAPLQLALVELQSCWLTIDHTNLTPEQVQTLIGPEGVTIDALQYLANATLNLKQDEEQQNAYTIELTGYRAQRYAALMDIAEAAAAQARQTGEEFEMQPLSAAERRLIHTVLKASQDLETYSRGQEPNRRLVVKPLLG